MSRPPSRWTVLLYLNGNNELEPEMWNAKMLTESVNPGEDVKVILQLGRAERELARLMRPSDQIPDANEEWTGVRRYQLDRGKAVMLQELGTVNMADPRQLYEFVSWGMRTYEAEHYLLALGGHGYQFVGLMVDFSQEKPYVLGLPEMAHSLRLACSELHRVIDILVLDSCYCNFMEVLYEIGRKDGCVSTVITHADEAPLEGMPYHQLIPVIRDSQNNKDPVDVSRRIISNVALDLAAFTMDAGVLFRVKQLFSELAEMYLSLDADGRPALSRLVSRPLPEDPWYDVATELRRRLSALAVRYQGERGFSTPINVAASPLDSPDKVSLYHRLAFSRSNSWFDMLRRQPVSAALNPACGDVLLPLALNRQTMGRNLAAMNPQLNEAQVETLLSQLLHYRHWELDSSVEGRARKS